jgi:hypothetical protein
MGIDHERKVLMDVEDSGRKEGLASWVCPEDILG